MQGGQRSVLLFGVEIEMGDAGQERGPVVASGGK
jgi:hypothetical protein